MKELFLSFKYSFSSGTGELEGYRYIQNVFIDIYASDIETEEEVLIGKSRLKLILINQAIEDHFSLPELFDTDPDIFFIGDQVFDLENENICSVILDKYPECSLSLNIGVLDRLVLIPEYRGYGISQKVIKDTIFHFMTACGLFVIHPFPLQFEGEHCMGEDTWEDKNWYKGLETNEKKAFKQLTAFYQKLGFEQIKGVEGLLFYCPFYKNKKLDKVDLSELTVIPD